MPKTKASSPFLLKRLHQRLVDSVLWYKKWHKWEGSTAVHAALFLVAAISTISYLMFAVKTTEIKASTQSWSNTGFNSWTFNDSEKFGTRIRLSLELTDPTAVANATFPSGRRNSAAAWNPNDNKFYIFGGELATPEFTALNQTNQIISYDPVTDTSTTKSGTLPQDLSYTSAVWSPTQNKFYLFGGVHVNPPVGGTPQSPSAQIKIMEYDPVTDILTEKATTISPNVAVGARAVWSTTTNKAYIIGGRSVMFSSPENSIYEYDPATDTVATKTTMPNGRDFTVSVWDPNFQRIYIIGGYTNNGGYRMTNSVFEYNPLTDTIVTKSGNLPNAATMDALNPYREPASGYYDVTQEKIILGAITEGSSSTRSSSLLAYTPTTDAVTTAGSVPYILWETTSAYSETSNLGYFFGGVAGNGTPVPVLDTFAQSPQYSFKASGTAKYVYTPSAGTVQDWQSIIVNTTLNGQTVTAQYTNNTDCTTGLVSNLALVPNSESLCIKLTLATSNPFVSPRVSSVSLTYDTPAAEPDPTPTPPPPVDDPTPTPDPVVVVPTPTPPVINPVDNPIVVPPSVVVDVPATAASPSPSPSPVSTPTPIAVNPCATGITNFTITAESDRATISFTSATSVVATLYVYPQSKTATAGAEDQKATGYTRNSTVLEEGGASRSHALALSELLPNTTYYYTLFLGGTQDCEHSFTTQAASVAASPIVVASTGPDVPAVPGTTTRRSPRAVQPTVASSPKLLAAPSLFTENLPPQAQFVLGVTTRTALGVTTAAAVIPLAIEAALNSIQIAISIPNFFTSLWLNLIQLLSKDKKRKPWGIAKDSFSGEELANTIVKLIVVDGNGKEKMLEQVVTDKEGRFGFLAGTGTYRLMAEHEYYSFPTKLLPQSYQGTPFRIEESQPLTLILYLDRLIKRTNWSFILKKIVVVLEKIRFPLLVLGTCIAVYNYLNYPYITINVAFLIFYIFLWILELLNLRKSRNTIQFVDEKGHPLPFILVRFVNDKTGQVTAHKVTDKVGEIYLLVPAGHYTVIVPSPRHPQGTSHKINLPQGVAPGHVKIKVEY